VAPCVTSPAAAPITLTLATCGCGIQAGRVRIAHGRIRHSDYVAEPADASCRNLRISCRPAGAPRYFAHVVATQRQPLPAPQAARRSDGSCTRCPPCAKPSHKVLLRGAQPSHRTSKSSGTMMLLVVVEGTNVL
jgi:hypothetical protein